MLIFYYYLYDEYIVWARVIINTGRVMATAAGMASNKVPDNNKHISFLDNIF